MRSSPQTELQRFRAQVSHFLNDQTYVQKAALVASKKKFLAEQHKQSSFSGTAAAGTYQMVQNLHSSEGIQTSGSDQLARLSDNMSKCLYPVNGNSASKGASPTILQPSDDRRSATSKFFEGTFQNRLYVAVFTGVVLLLVLAVADPSVSVLHKHLEEVQSARAERDLLQGEVSRLQQELKNATDRAQLAENIKANPKPAHVTRGQEKKLEQALVLANEDGGGVMQVPDSTGILPKVDWEWVSKRTREDRTIIVVRMWVLDITDYKNNHPGGDVFRAGEDMTQAFYDMHACFPDILEIVQKLVVATIDKLAQPPLATVQPNDVDKEGIASLEGEVATNDEADLSCLDNLMDASQKRRNSQWILVVGGVCLVLVLIFAVMQTLPKFNAIRKGTTALKEQSDLNGAHSIAKSYLNYSP
mmetsp:Transcript_35428/g.67812  ORF Transcript_35428/g.67812 Transcript_35428/m.67812 type:complete len:416 (+) Transcript_35428:187-1434(+)